MCLASCKRWCMQYHAVLRVLDNLEGLHHRRKFRSQTSDSMDRWKSRGGKSQKREEKRSEKRKSQRKEAAGTRKDRKVAIHCVFLMICCPGGSKSRLAKAAGAEPSGQMRDEKLHAVVARSTFRSQKCLKLTVSDHFWKLGCWKSARRCGAKHISKSECQKHRMFAPLLDVEAWFCVVGAKGSAPCQEWAKREGFVAFPKTMAGVGHLKRIWISRGRRNARDMFIRDVRRSGRWFPKKGCILEHESIRFAKRILRDMCSALYDLASLFSGRRGALDTWSGKIAKHIGTRPSALHSTFHSWVSQNCFVFDVVNLKQWGRLAE